MEAPVKGSAAITETEEAAPRLAPQPSPEPLIVPPPPISADEAAATVSGEEFTFSVPMVLEPATMAVVAKSDLESEPDVKSSESAAAPGDTVEAWRASRVDGVDEAAIAGAVQRVMEKFKPQIVTEIIRELSKYPR